jgi:hypothetical protein
MLWQNQCGVLLQETRQPRDNIGPFQSLPDYGNDRLTVSNPHLQASIGRELQAGITPVTLECQIDHLVRYRQHRNGFLPSANVFKDRRILRQPPLADGERSSTTVIFVLHATDVTGLEQAASVTPILVPSLSGWNVLRMTSGIRSRRAGAIVSGWRIVAPAWASSPASSYERLFSRYPPRLILGSHVSIPSTSFH